MSIRTEKLLANVEPEIHAAAMDAANKDACSISNYLRNLIIRDLIMRGMLDEKMKMSLIVA